MQGVSFATLLLTVPLGISAGLLLGKAIGVFGAAWLMIRLTQARLPDQANWMQLFGVCVLCGVGFTMSLFIGGLAFAGQGAAFETQLKLGVLMGSILSGVLGAVILLRSAQT